MPKVPGSDRLDIQTTDYGGQFIASQSVPFSAGDVGKGLYISGGGTWQTGMYLIDSSFGAFPVTPVGGGAPVSMWIVTVSIDGQHVLPAQGQAGVGYTCTLLGQVFCLGNSNTVPTPPELRPAYWNVMMAGFPINDWYVHVEGHSGAQTQDLLNISTYNVDAFLLGGGVQNIITFNEWINAFDASNESPATQVGQLETWQPARHTAGWAKVVVIGSGIAGTSDAFAPAMDAALEGSFAIADGFIAVSAIPELAAPLNSTYYDGVHWKAPGHLVLGNAINPVLLAAAGIGTITSVTVDQQGVSLAGGATQQYTVTVVGTASDKTVAWSKTSGVGSIDASTGIYTAPSATGSPQTAVIRATSNFDGTKYDESTVTTLAAGSPVYPSTVPALGDEIYDLVGKELQAFVTANAIVGIEPSHGDSLADRYSKLAQVYTHP